MGIIRSERHCVLIPWESRELCLLCLCSCPYLYIVSNQFVRFEMMDVHNVLVHKLNIVSNPNRDIVPFEMDVISYRDLFADVQKSVYLSSKRFVKTE